MGLGDTAGGQLHISKMRDGNYNLRTQRLDRSVSCELFSL